MASLTKRTIFPHVNGESPLDTVKGVSSQFYNGIDDMINHKFTVLTTGYAYIYWVHLPDWFEKDEDLKYFKAMTQKNFVSFQGLSTVQLSTGTYQSGFAGNEVTVPTGVERGNTQFTIEHVEYSGSPMRRLYQKWCNYIRDHRTGIAPYCKIFGVEYGPATYTGELLYITVRPDANNNTTDILESAVYYSNVFPTNYDLGLYNYQRGQQDNPHFTGEYVGVPDWGPEVDEYARKVLKENILNIAEDSEDGAYGFLTSGGNDTEEVKLMAGSGRLKDIYADYYSDED